MAQQTLSPAMQKLADAIRAHPKPVQVALCGFDLWIEALSSPHISLRDMVRGGTWATGEERETDLKVPILVLGGRIAVSFDPTQAPDGFELRP